MSLYRFLNKGEYQELVAFDLRAANGLEVIWHELKWDEFMQQIERGDLK